MLSELWINKMLWPHRVSPGKFKTLKNVTLLSSESYFWWVVLQHCKWIWLCMVCSRISNDLTLETSFCNSRTFTTKVLAKFTKILQIPREIKSTTTVHSDSIKTLLVMTYWLLNPCTMLWVAKVAKQMLHHKSNHYAIRHKQILLNKQLTQNVK